MLSPGSEPGLLSSGRLPFWKQSKPRLAVDEIDPSTGAEPLPVSSRAIASVAKAAALLVGVLVMFTVSAWVILGVTVMPTPRVDGNAWAVKWAAWPQGAVPADSLVAVVAGPVETSIPARFRYQFASDQVTIQRVLAGPGGTVEVLPDGTVTWNGTPVSARAGDTVTPGPLGDAYLAVCEVGDCGGQGAASIVPVDSVMGQARGIYTPPFTVSPPSSEAEGNVQ